MTNDHFRERLGKLFEDIDRLAADPNSALPQINRQLEELRARLCELETQFMESKNRVAEQEDAPTLSDEKNAAEAEPAPHRGMEDARAPILYEKEQVGYVYSGDEVRSIQDIPADVKPASEISAPLIAAGQPIGNVQVAPPSERNLNPEEAALLQAVAQRASQQIENLRLLAATERARAEAEAATRRYMHEGWTSFMDAIHQSERVGYAYDQTSVIPFLERTSTDNGIVETVKVMEEQVGTLYVKPDPNQPLSEEDKEIVASIARQIAQQVENIRLLADASRARAEAEDATRQFTRESWQTFASQQEESQLGFVYDTNQVIPLKDATLPQDESFAQPLTVRGEPIGRLAVSGWKDAPPDAIELMSAVARQASVHLETLRLNDELRKRAAELQELDRLKSAFLANMSHELRTPLNSILGFSDVILEKLDGPLTDTMENDLRLIQKNGQHLLHLINDVLDMAKIESGRMNLNPEKFNLQDILQEVVSITSTLASEKNLALFIHPTSDHDVEIFADRTRLRQVMINLVNNAIKFTPNGKIALSVSKMDSARILVTVKDTGLGIPADHLEAIFQEFTQVDTSTTRKVGGTGLGLPISRRLVEMHGGRLWAESTGVEGEGSTFYVELPLEARITEVVEKKEK